MPPCRARRTAHPSLSLLRTSAYPKIIRLTGSAFWGPAAAGDAFLHGRKAGEFLHRVVAGHFRRVADVVSRFFHGTGLGTVPPFPWRHRMRVSPQPDLRRAGSLFRLGIGFPLCTNLLALIFLVVPG